MFDLMATFHYYNVLRLTFLYRNPDHLLQVFMTNQRLRKQYKIWECYNFGAIAGHSLQPWLFVQSSICVFCISRWITHALQAHYDGDCSASGGKFSTLKSLITGSNRHVLFFCCTYVYYLTGVIVHSLSFSLISLFDWHHRSCLGECAPREPRFVLNKWWESLPGWLDTWPPAPLTRDLISFSFIWPEDMLTLAWPTPGLFAAGYIVAVAAAARIHGGGNGSSSVSRCQIKAFRGSHQRHIAARWIGRSSGERGFAAASLPHFGAIVIWCWCLHYQVMVSLTRCPGQMGGFTTGNVSIYGALSVQGTGGGRDGGRQRRSRMRAESRQASLPPGSGAPPPLTTPPSPPPFLSCKLMCLPNSPLTDWIFFLSGK